MRELPPDTECAAARGIRPRAAHWNSNVKLSPYSARSRSRVLPVPMCAPDPSPSASGLPVLCTLSSSQRSSRRESITWRASMLHVDALLFLGCTMDHGVLRQRLQDQARHHRILHGSVDADREAQAIGESQLLDLEIVAHEVDFARERHQVRIAVAQGSAQQVAEAHDDLPCDRGPRVDEAAHRVQRIEQEVRVQLHAQRVQIAHADSRARAVPGAAGGRAGPDTCARRESAPGRTNTR